MKVVVRRCNYQKKSTDHILQQLIISISNDTNIINFELIQIYVYIHNYSTMVCSGDFDSIESECFLLFKCLFLSYL